MSIDRSKKPQADLEVKCPHCESLLRVKFWRQRQDEPPEPDYETAIDAEEIKQGKLFETERARPVKGAGRVAVEIGV